ncbi:unnamed protein product [Phytomonas sp. Hart1]|nr:unnamed protein product [Phytomonas sp. Hart1]|eukprot:CCW71837.1 unnamed protein product [Phytomonas sp. isolate Hart1]
MSEFERTMEALPTEESAIPPNQSDDATSDNDDNHLPLQNQCDMQLVQILQDMVPLNNFNDIIGIIKNAKNSMEVRHFLYNIVYKHHLCFDPLNGHNYRVAVLQSLTSVAPRTHCMHEWFDCVDRFRRLGFILTRTYAAEGYTTIRQWLSTCFNFDGRTPRIITEGISHIRELTQWCQEDRLVFDHVLYTRIVFLLTMMVSFFDRQNLYRASFPANFAKRDGIVVEWVVGNERSTDYDECVLQCDAFLEEILDWLHKDVPSRPSFSLMYRLMDYYFATDNVAKMLATMEDAVAYGLPIAESSSAKLLQLACALNYPTVPALFLRWRVALPQCVLATPDMSRLLLYYGRAGGGRPCPVCGESFNHRNASVYQWRLTPPHQRRCPALAMARVAKGELEECRALPQNADWAGKAFQLWELSRRRSIEWTTVEWRAFLLCCMFSARALEAVELMNHHIDPSKMDDFLRATLMRLLRHHAPEHAVTTLEQWTECQYKISPIALQEGLMAAAAVDDADSRYYGMQRFWKGILEKDAYIMPFTKRNLQKRYTALLQQEGGLSEEEINFFDVIIASKPEKLSLLDLKDSASDYMVGTFIKNVYIPSSVPQHLNGNKTQPN